MEYLALFGLFLIIYYLSGPMKSLVLYVMPNVNLKKRYGEWVVITGSTDGMGKALAKKFAGQGFNIVQISRN
jgi:hypothetical protein